MNLKKIIEEILEQVGIYNGADNQVLEFDSLQYITLIVELEERFNITIDEEYLYQSESVSVNDIISMVEDHLIR